MAKVLGESGRYVSNQTVVKLQRILLSSILIISFASTVEGLILGRWLFPAKPAPSVSIPIMVSLLVIMLWVWRSFSGKMAILEKERSAMQRGAAGEIGVGSILQKFPDNFYVINDLTTPFGNLHHVVVGPSGVFILDTKNWRGVVAADGKGELLLNGKPTDKPFVRQFIGRMMGIRDKVKLIAPGPEAFHEAVFVFTAARVEANWGKTSSVNCIRDDQLHDYIVEKNFGERLEAHVAERIAQAFLAVARMDKDF
ncbi:MAG TPA: nuclease-related domain-containing protein [Candidatus Saccharimonadales bacterium]|nr:nuclease-related domain-containing protein [Candidatus Saccharimonadales bacterium]